MYLIEWFSLSKSNIEYTVLTISINKKFSGISVQFLNANGFIGTTILSSIDEKL